MEHRKASGITDAIHGSPHNITFFTPADTPNTLPDRSSVWHGSGLKLVVRHSLGYSTVEPLYELNAHRLYSKNGRGADIPIAVRVNPPIHYSAQLPRSSYRQLELDQEYTLPAAFLSKRNQATIVALSREVLAKTHCRGGTVTEDRTAPDFAESYNRRSKAPSGLSIRPSWVVKFLCSRWRAK